MTTSKKVHSQRAPGAMDHATSAINAWFGDHLERTGNGLAQTMAFYEANRPKEPEELSAPPHGKVCVLVHGLGCNETSWTFRGSDDDYGKLLQRGLGYLPLYLRFNTGLHISVNGALFNDLLARYCSQHGEAISELLLIGHSMGGLVLRSACHLGSEAGHGWVALVRHLVYLGSPHLGAPLERFTNLATRVLGRFDTTATRVIRDLLNTRSAGVKDLRFGNLVDRDWCGQDPDETAADRRSSVPWLATARHHFVVGEAVPRLTMLGDAMVSETSAAGGGRDAVPEAPEGSRVQLMKGLHHVDLAHHPAVYEHLERWVSCDG